MRAAVLVAALALALFAGCGEDDAEAPRAPAEPTGEDLVVYSRSGGIAFSEDRLTIDRDGHAVLTTEFGQGEQRREFKLGVAELDQLESRLAAAAGVESPGPTAGCSDCYVYEVKADGVAVSLDDASFGAVDIPPEVTGLVTLLGNLVERNR